MRPHGGTGGACPNFSGVPATGIGAMSDVHYAASVTTPFTRHYEPGAEKNGNGLRGNYRAGFGNSLEITGAGNGRPFLS